MKTEVPELVQLERRAMDLKNNGNWEAAARIFEQILQSVPDWEHGYGNFDLAECYEEMGRIAEARSAYERAVQTSPTDIILLGGLASFLYLHGDPAQAFDCHIRLLVLERRHANRKAISDTLSALMSLGARLGWSEHEIENRIESASASLPPSIPNP